MTDKRDWSTVLEAVRLAASRTHRENVPRTSTIPDTANNALLDGGDRKVQVITAMRTPRLVVLNGLLSDTECDELIVLAKPQLTRSQVVDYATGNNYTNAVRTSNGALFQRGEHALCMRIERRIAKLVNWPLEHGEGLQVLHYPSGAEFRPHHDYFDPAQPGTANLLKRGGHRLGTVIMYLNTTTRGGITVFPDVGLEIMPIKGNAVFFNYAQPHPSTKTFHTGTKVLEGEKWIATKWLRQGVHT